MEIEIGYRLSFMCELKPTPPPQLKQNNNETPRARTSKKPRLLNKQNRIKPKLKAYLKPFYRHEDIFFLRFFRHYLAHY